MSLSLCVAMDRRQKWIDPLVSETTESVCICRCTVVIDIIMAVCFKVFVSSSIYSCFTVFFRYWFDIIYFAIVCIILDRSLNFSFLCKIAYTSHYWSNASLVRYNCSSLNILTLYLYCSKFEIKDTSRFCDWRLKFDTNSRLLYVWGHPVQQI